MKRNISLAESKQQIKALEKALERNNRSLRWFFDRYIAPDSKLDRDSFVFKLICLKDANGYYHKINQFLKDCMRTPRKKPRGSKTAQLFGEK